MSLFCLSFASHIFITPRSFLHSSSWFLSLYFTFCSWNSSFAPITENDFFPSNFGSFPFPKKTLRSLDQRQSVNTLWFTTIYYFPHLQFFPEKLYMRGKKPRDYYDSNDFKVASKIEEAAAQLVSLNGGNQSLSSVKHHISK